MHRKQNQVQSLIKKACTRITFEISLYFHQFISLSLLKQGNYYVSVTLCSKQALLRQINKQGIQNSLGKTLSTRSFFIKYNNHIELLSQAKKFSFYLEHDIFDKKQEKNAKLLLVFQLYHCKNSESEEPERKLEQQYQACQQFTYELKPNEQMAFIEYFNFKFDLPYAGELSGFLTCMMVKFELKDSQKLINAEGQMLSRKRNELQTYQLYDSLVAYLKKLIKKYRFSNYSIQKALLKVLGGYELRTTIPIRAEKNRQTLDSFETSNQQNISANNQKINLTLCSLKEPRTEKYFNFKEKACNEQQFMKYLTYIQYEYKTILQLTQQLTNIGLINVMVLQKIQELVNKDIPTIANISALEKQYRNNKEIIYSQRTVFVQETFKQASQEMKLYSKNICSLKSKVKENFFTSMNQLFNLTPDSESELQCIRFDKCPYVFHSWAKMNEGMVQEREKQEKMQGNRNNQEDTVSDKGQSIRNLFFIAHGYQGSSNNMEHLKIKIKKLFLKSKVLLLKSYSHNMDRSIDEMGNKAARQIEAFINGVSDGNRKFRIVMIGHSMGGLILRASFQYLSEKTKKLFHTFITFGTPHLGYINSKNFLTQTGIKLIHSIQPSLSIKQLSNKDNSNIKETYIYKLAETGSLKEFENVIVLSSIQDKYVPWNSARIQLYKQPTGVGGKNTSGWSMGSQKHYLRYVEQQIINHILGVGQKSKIKNIHRFEVDFSINHTNIDTIIGRTAHIAFLMNEHLLQIIFEYCLGKSLYCELKNQN